MIVVANLFAGFTSAAAAQELGVGIKVPLQIYAALGLTERLTFEMGVPLAFGPAASLAAVGQLKLWITTLDISGFEALPYLGAGGHVGVTTRGAVTIIQLMFHGLVGIDFPIPNTSFTLLGEVWIVAGEGLGFVYNLGVRYDF
jgi:hypothetical protein